MALCLNLTFAFTAYERLMAGIEGEEAFQTRIIIHDLLQTTSLLFGAISIVLDMLNRNKLVNILEKIIQFDTEVRCLRLNLCNELIVFLLFIEKNNRYRNSV